MKVVINKCYGGFGLSPLAIVELAKLKGRECWFFDAKFRTHGGKTTYQPLTMAEASTAFCPHAFDVPDPNAVDEELLWEQHAIDSRPEDRTDPDLVAVVETLGEAANGRHAKLRIIEIPDGVNWEIDEYDGMESVKEAHRSWS